ncbi:MAG TPA: glycosyltransferase family 2 protein [Caldilineaceae bacterium]|nr:glycosyltransferase family 2 protein [Caldilineaceae bacterium]
MTTNVSVAIINFNTAPLLIRCLQNLQRLGEATEIIVVDNASTDGSAARVQQEFPEVTLIALPENRGLPAGSNLALAKATGTYVLYLGTDAYPEAGVIHGLATYLDAHPTVAVATAELRLRDGTLDRDAHRGFPTPWASFTHFSGLNRLFPHAAWFNQYFLGQKDLAVPHEIDLCISHFMFCRRQVLTALGGWDEDFFLYGEDVDLCYRVKAAGHKIMYLPQFRVLHYKGASVGIRKQSSDISTASEETKLRATLLSTEAMARFYRKHLYARYPLPVSAAVMQGIRLLGILRRWRARQRHNRNIREAGNRPGPNRGSN